MKLLHLAGVCTVLWGMTDCMCVPPKVDRMSAGCDRCKYQAVQRSWSVHRSAGMSWNINVRVYDKCDALEFYPNGGMPWNGGTVKFGGIVGELFAHVLHQLS